MLLLCFARESQHLTPFAIRELHRDKRWQSRTLAGLGHLGIQYARQMGFRTVAIGRGADKKALAQKLGAHEYIDTDAGAPADALQKLGGANVIVATAPDRNLFQR